jgi:hypothetical protein
MKRAIIQIAATARPDGDADLYALCNDGTLWGLTSGWTEMPPIPQDESQDPLSKQTARNMDLSEKLREAEHKLYRLTDLASEITGYSGQNRWADAHRTIGDKMTEILEIENK